MRPILINGFWRSGTTYLFKYLKWISNGKALFEPITSLSVNPKVFYKNKFIKELITDRFFYTIPFFYNKFLLKNFLSKIKDFSIKEVTLHFYLDDEFIKENWDIYLIIRHPGDTFISYIQAFFKRTYH